MDFLPLIGAEVTDPEDYALPKNFVSPLHFLATLHLMIAHLLLIICNVVTSFLSPWQVGFCNEEI